MSLINKIELFEKLAVYNRSTFLQSLAAGKPTPVSDDVLIPAIAALDNALQIWLSTHAEKQSDLPSGQIKGYPEGIRYAASEIAKMATNPLLDSKSLSDVLNALKILASINNLGDINAIAKNAWMENVFPKANKLIEFASKQLAYLNWYKETQSESLQPEVKEVASKSSVKEVEIKSKESFPKELQTKLNELLSKVMNAIPEDGIWGPKTAKALKLFREFYFVPGNYSREQAIEVLRNV